MKIPLPFVLTIPVYWWKGRQARVLAISGAQLARIERTITYPKRILGLPVYHIETLTYISTNTEGYSCSVNIRPRFPLEFADKDGKPFGCLKIKKWSVWPEGECMGQAGEKIGTMQGRIGSTTLKISLETDSICTGHFSRAKSKDLKPRQYVWEFSADVDQRLDVRLLLGFVASTQMPKVLSS